MGGEDGEGGGEGGEGGDGYEWVCCGGDVGGVLGGGCVVEGVDYGV